MTKPSKATTARKRARRARAFPAARVVAGLVLLMALAACGGIGGSLTTTGGANQAGQGATLADGAAAFFGRALTPEHRGTFGLQRAHVFHSEDARFTQMLRVIYPANSASQTAERDDGTADGGAQLYLRLANGPTDLLHLRYYVRFPTGFDFVKGGKLPGLFGGTVMDGQHIPDGTNGLSTRYMWRTGGAAEVYAYLPTSREHGTSLGRGAWQWPTGRWICIEQAVRLNTPGRSDGSIMVWADGRPVFRANGLTFRTVGSLRIEGVFFSSFFGGDDATWASPRDQYADLAAFAVSDHYIGPVITDSRAVLAPTPPPRSFQSRFAWSQAYEGERAVDIVTH